MRRSAFGDDHHAAIDATIDVLKDKLTEDQVYDTYPNRDEDPDNEDSVPENIHSAAVEAAQWIAGESEFKSLTENWAGLCREQVAPVRKQSRLP